MQKLRKIVRDAGVLHLGSRAIAFVYRRAIRPLLPKEPVRYAGIVTGVDRRWGDGRVPALWRPYAGRDMPEYEAALLQGLEQHVREGDRVVVVGGGYGVTATFSAQRAGVSGRVECYEGAREGTERVRRTAERNGVADRVRIHHAVVARPISVYGAQPEGAVVAPGDLPECDVLELDCEGAEVEILRHLRISPRVILVETHGLFGAPTPLVLELLRERGYQAEVIGVAEPRMKEYCEKHDIRVVAGTRADGPAGV
ncbi:MAG: hypothetical protein AVDCRST_MAG68-1047 [uncultured Gemmatimonadetes bacterium]|uniref:Methyltransferase FkbM domain-containing protein n=1 Tax=uncultured Gemmatimonadota bacterium TaxID=203437 RepID=A0A6J4KK57_9BACT|nr:MAG: hypothetical protein AVDCRST_MAG68-1047 [uncultured Gemmatimonadota bacterium]